MDLVDGVDLRRHLARTGPLAPAAAADIAAQAAALTAAHAVGVVYSDVKPANILVPADGAPVRLADFGAARLTPRAAAICYGAPNYVAPEVVRGHAALPASDAYGLGIVLYEMLAGASPYREPAEVRRRHLEL